MNPNILSFCLQPDEGFHQRFDIKVPDTLDERRPVEWLSITGMLLENWSSRKRMSDAAGCTQWGYFVVHPRRPG
jgi:hypothetical protein